jgi:PLP dependent protein
MEPPSDIAGAVSRVRERIAAACARAGRDPAEVTLVAVSKTHGPDAIRAAHAAGLRHFGESYAQELRDKADALPDLDLQWHFVGRIQTNKVRYIVGTASLVHAVDRLEAAQALSDRVERTGASPLEVLVSVNVGQEASKGGATPETAVALCGQVADMPGLRLRGLMCLPPFTEDPEGARPYFDRLRVLSDEIRGKIPVPGTFQLSMGMSHDIEVAIEAGATLVRVGTALFGERKRRA